MPSTAVNEFDDIWAPPNKAVDDNGVVHDRVQDAIDNASDFVIVGPGTFEEQLTVDSAGLSMRGAGRGTVIDGTTGDVAIDVAANDVSLASIAARTDEGQGGGNYPVRVQDAAEGVVLRVVRVITGDDSAFRIIGAKTKMIACVVEYAQGQGINFTGSSEDCGAMGCIIENVTSIGIRLDGQRGYAIGNSVKGNGSTGIQLNDPDCTVMGNTIDQTDGDGLEVLGASDNATIVGNSVTNPDQNQTGSPAIDTSNAPAGAQLIGNNPSGKDTPVGQSDDLTDAGWVQRLVDTPNGQFPNSVLDNGESAEITVPVPDGETIKVFRWGAYKVSDGTTPADLDLELKDGADTVRATENTGDTESTDPAAPVASHTNNSGSVSIYKIAIVNDTGGTITDPGVGGFAAYVVE